MTNQQLYLSIGLPILVNILNTIILILYMNVEFEALEETINRIEKES